MAGLRRSSQSAEPEGGAATRLLLALVLALQLYLLAAIALLIVPEVYWTNIVIGAALTSILIVFEGFEAIGPQMRRISVLVIINAQLALALYAQSL